MDHVISARVSQSLLALDFSASGNLYGAHRLHAFAAKCPPPLVRWAIERYIVPGETVIDGMAGSGTTLQVLDEQGETVEVLAVRPDADKLAGWDVEIADAVKTRGLAPTACRSPRSSNAGPRRRRRGPFHLGEARPSRPAGGLPAALSG